jgi:hypothetical protein
MVLPMARGRPRKHTDEFDYVLRQNWYNSHGWQPIAAEIIRTAKHRCALCGTVADRCEVHHPIDPYPTRSIKLLLDPGNMQVLCAACHRRAHNDQGASIICETCGKLVHRTPSKAAIGRFCSLACRDKHPDFLRLPDRVCGICGITFTPIKKDQRFCSHDCCTTFTGRLKLARRPAFICPICDKTFNMPPSYASRPRVRQPCCSKQCANLNR